MRSSIWPVALAAGALGLAAIAACGTAADPPPFAPDGDDGGSSSSSGGSSSGGSSGSSSSGGACVGFGCSSGGSSGGSGSSSGAATGCDSTCSTAGGTCSGTSCTLAENPGGIAAAVQSKLQGGGTADATFKWLYPYDKTVFPRGLVSPTMQFDGGAADAVYVHITGTGLDYKGWFKGGAAGAVQTALSQKAWDAVTRAVGGTALKVSVTSISGSAVTGPITETWTVAPGSIRGTIYYETYNSTIIAGSPVLAEAAGIGIMKIQPGASQPTVLKSGCGNVCHTASADGSTLVSSTGVMNTAQSESWDLKNNGAAIAPVHTGNVFTYGGLYPDGTFLMSATDFRVSTNTASRLYDTKTAANIPAPGWDGVITRGGTTAFSPDGKQIAFIHEDKDGHTLAKMDFAVATKTFSGLVDLANDPGGYLAWPAFTPDGKTIIYHSGSSASFETDLGATGDVFAVDVATKKVRRLDALDGYTGPGTGTYLPANDPGLTFAPTVLPEAVGGYFWAVFTSHRSYGFLSPSKAPAGTDQNGKLWVAAIDINGAPGSDISHPAFYLDGQELSADNLRGFWVLPPCQKDGTNCSAGDQCCTGFCRGTNGGDLTCVEPPKGCANQGERCAVTSDCCDVSEQCIGGYCALPAPPQ